MRRLVILLLAAIAATSAYNFVLQEIALTGDLIADNTITCKNVHELHIAGYTKNFVCYEMFSPDDATKLEARKIVYQDNQITTKAAKLDIEIVLSDGSKITYTLTPGMKTGVLQTPTGSGIDPTPAAPPSTTTTAPAQPLPDCGTTEGAKEPECLCKDPKKNEEPKCKEFCVDQTDTDTYKACKKPDDGDNDVKHAAKAVKKTVPRPQHLFDCATVVDARKPECVCQNRAHKAHQTCITFCEDGAHLDYDACRALHASNAAAAAAAGAATIIVDALPPAIRLRGPGPVIPPIRQSPPVVSEEDEERRVKRAAGDANDDNQKQVPLSMSYYILDEPGNAAAVWAAVIEGIILLVLVGACCYFFFWAPRSRAKASATAEPYKEEGPNYSVSYANSSFNQRNERIDAFQNPPAPTPAAPPRPANSAYMDDYITDNIGAMSRPGGTAQTAAPAAAPAFEPRHQRFDSSGLVTVNLS